MATSSSLRLDSQGLLRCAEPRRNHPELECHTGIARPLGDRLEIRCRNCGSVATFEARDGKIVALSELDGVCLASGRQSSVAS